MKRAHVLLLAALLVVMFTVPASAVEHAFGGYWRTRFYTNQNFLGTDEETVKATTGYALNTKTGAIVPTTTVSDNSLDLSQVDTRTRLYYTAKINDSLRLVNKFEMDAVWGGPKAGYGDVGADGKDLEIKNTYADFDLQPVRIAVGIQDFVLARGFTFDDDAAGMKVIYKVNDGLYLPFSWIRWMEGYSVSTRRTDKRNAADQDSLTFAPKIFLSKDISMSPTITYITSRRDDSLVFGLEGTVGELDAYFLGFDFDAKFNPVTLWFTGVYQTGTAEASRLGGGFFGVAPEEEIDLAGYLLAGGVKVDLGMADIHGQAFYASGDDAYKGPADNGIGKDKELDAFFSSGGPGYGASYYWAEIMGLGLFDVQASAGAPGSKISNIFAANIGTTVKPMSKLSLTFDVWYAELAEDNAAGNNELGTELDLRVTYELVQGLKLDVVGAYLFAGDATYDGPNDENPYEIGTQLSLSF